MAAPSNVHIGLDIGGTKMLAVAYDESYNVLARSRCKTKGNEGKQAVLGRVEKSINDVIVESCATADAVSTIGIGCPGQVDMNDGTVIGAVNLGWDNVQLAEFVTSRFNCATTVINDVDAGVYGESLFGAAKGAGNVLGVFPGTGIGGGAVIDGKIVSGNRRSAMEIGHVQIIPNGIRCGCGKIGCVETVASRLAIASLAAQAAYRGQAPWLLEHAGTDIALIRSGVLASAIENGDTAVESIIKRACRHLGQVIGSIANLFDPDVVVLGGGLVEAMPELFVLHTHKHARKQAIPAIRDTFEVKAALLGDDANVLGAAAWAVNNQS